MTTTPWSRAEDARSIATLRSLSVDQVQAAGIGHIGLPLGAAPIVHTVFSKFLVSDPADPAWVNRDRFVLSAGHGSALLYAALHLAGYALSTDDLRAFRQWGSITPGHPESHLTPGVDATTGPLGQGIANAVGMAISETMGAARLNRDDATVIDHRTFVLVGDGDLMEGVALEATALAGRLGLGKLIVYYDDNDVVIDGRASVTHSADGVCASLAAYGWHVSDPIDGNDLDALEKATELAIADASRPSLIRVRTRIGFGSRLEDDPVIHSGAVSADEAAHIKARLGKDFATAFEVPADVRAAWARFAERGADARAAWQRQIERYGERHPVGADQLRRWTSAPASIDVAALITERPAVPEPVRMSSGTVLNAIAATADDLVGGAADLAHATFAHITDGGTYGADERGARNVAYGIREHAMGAISNGIALHGLFRPFASTFMVFAGYEANALRMAALQELPVIHVLSHDSITVGEDGPTHQPIETLALLRATPNTLVLRPADFAETVTAWQLALDNLRGPTVLAVARTAVPQLDHTRQVGSASRGGYLLSPAEGEAGPDVVIAASGLEVGLAVEAASLLRERGIDAAVVSLPSHELFLAQDAAYRDAVLPPDVPRLIVEASHPLSLWRLAGPLGAVYGIDRFGASAPPDVLLEQYGFTPRAIADAAAAQVATVLREVVS